MNGALGGEEVVRDAVQHVIDVADVDMVMQLGNAFNGVAGSRNVDRIMALGALLAAVAEETTPLSVQIVVALAGRADVTASPAGTH